jgi:hypothetical protein
MLQIQPNQTLNEARTYKIEILYQGVECVMIYGFLRIDITALAKKTPLKTSNYIISSTSDIKFNIREK